jgi:hypothetical protein
LKFEKRSQFFVGGDDESLSVVAVCISNEDRLSVGINRCDAVPTPTGFAEIVSDDFPELHLNRIVPLLVSTEQSQNDMKGRNDAGDNIRHRGDGNRFVVHADEKLTAFLELESQLSKQVIHRQ